MTASTCTAGELLRAELCTPSCLVAGGGEAAHCGCRCEGTYHGHLLHAQIQLAPGTPHPRSVVPHKDQLELDLNLAGEETP